MRSRPSRRWRGEVVVLANQPPEWLDALDALGLRPLLADVILDSLVGWAKPDPALLAYAYDRRGWDPAEVLVVGNRVDHDVVPALKLGCAVALVGRQTRWRVPAGVGARLSPRTAPPARPTAGSTPAQRARLRYVVAGLAELASACTGVGAAGGPR